MSAQVIQIGRQRFVGGLFWQSLSRRNELRAEAVELAKKLKFDLMVLRIDRGVAAAGYANTRDGFAPGHLSLGAMVSRAIALEGAFYNGRRQPAPNWLGAFALPDGRWAYFAVRDHAFMPNGDWVGSREEALERLHTDYAWGGWNVVIGEPELERQGFQNFQPKRLDELLPRRGGRPRTERWWALRPVERRLPPRTALIAAAAVCVAGGGLLAYWHHRAKVEAEEREAALARVRAELAARQAKSEPVAHPWATLPDAIAFSRACATRFGRLAPGGWRLERYECTPGTARYAWARNGSNVRYLLAEQPAAIVATDGERATLDVPLTAPTADDTPLVDDSAVRTQLLSRLQMLDAAAKLDRLLPDRSSHAPLANLAQQAAAAPAWRAYRFNASLGGLAPPEFMRAIDVPGLRVQRIAYQNNQWTLEGVLYAK
ncbi:MULTISPECIES: type 4b pilus protein PilO2 [Burkholderia]|uniref:PilO family protein n=1 Tax=Burkholderia savannae TaxID=1637837 RepID=A0ABR5T7Z1_9BURK|nr:MULTISPECIES: type 4b pilus protein PilO2 [Burkholderia]AOJ85098.1 pilO family protein [Burkholderia savannae]AOK51080.1 pilO family protein [Burkholderia sp. MSMB617WGS]KVK82236.1 pilO family protein [Burkholderia sp. MSMB1498]KWZ39305.1 pilO family protein [Burkholderia savannae]KWZ49254.1 pilO family protein [Burkholderia savannae]